MKILVLDSNRRQIAFAGEAFSKKNIDATVCATTNEFMAALGTLNSFEAVYINAETWGRGRSIYDYFGVGQKLESKPVVLYNAGENNAQICGRRSNEGDRVLLKPTSIETAINVA